MDLLEEARKVLDEGVICNNCLGRRFAQLSWGLSNYERGRALRTVIALDDDEEYERASAEDCWVCTGLFDELDNWAEKAVEAAEGYEFDNYLVGTKVPPLVEENEELLDEITETKYANRFKSEFNREVGKRIGAKLGKDVEFEQPEVVFLLDIQKDEVEFQINSEYFYGRYRKLERHIPQTEWPCRECDGHGCERCDGTGYMYDESVEELVRPEVLEATQGSQAVFHGAGREDVDALMLGPGRPFVIEVEEPRIRKVDLEELEDAINDYADGKVEVTELRRVHSDMVERVKELDATKEYRMNISFSSSVSREDLENAVEELVGIEVEQRTPNRVSHRRSDLVRTREVYDASAEMPEERSEEATVEIHGEGGLYVKELVSGDEGRTDPNLSELLGVDAEVESLDVIDVIGEFVKDDLVKDR